MKDYVAKIERDGYCEIPQVFPRDQIDQALSMVRKWHDSTETFLEMDQDGFCNRLLAYLDMNEIDYVISYYTNFYSKQLRDAYLDRILNVHPSILPAFKGMDGFGDSMGMNSEGTDGLSVYKDGWARGTVPAYICCRIFNRPLYGELAAVFGAGNTTYFPAYRKGELM